MDSLGLTTFYVYFEFSWEGATSENGWEKKEFNLVKLRHCMEQKGTAMQAAKQKLSPQKLTHHTTAHTKMEITDKTDCLKDFQGHLTKIVPQCCLRHNNPHCCSGKL